jgi:cytoskeletal protein CcmA (bactofilin family)
MSSANMITNGTTITGDISATGDIRIEGVLIGNLVTKGKLVVGQTGEIKGEITCNNSDIEGTIEGKIIVSELLSLKSTSKMIGDVVTNKLAIEPGAIFTGTCSMKDSMLNKIDKKKI